MGLISAILISLGISGAVRVGKETLAERGLMPVAYYHNLATEAVAQGDLDEAIRNNFRARLRNREFVPAQAQRDLLEMRVAQRQRAILKQLEQVQSQVGQLEEQLRLIWRWFLIYLGLAGAGGTIGGCFISLWLGISSRITVVSGILLGCGGALGYYLPKRSKMQQQLSEVAVYHRNHMVELEQENRRRALLVDDSLETLGE